MNSIKQEDHGSKPLFSKKGASQTLLNEFLFYVLSRVSSWQCMTELQVTTLDDVEALLLVLWRPSGIEIWDGNA